MSRISAGCGCVWCPCCRVVRGMDVVHTIEKAKVNKEDRPYEDIKILNITNLDHVDV